MTDHADLVDTAITIFFEGIPYVLWQDPYIFGPLSCPAYKACGVDRQGNEVVVYWDVVENWETVERKEDMCDWENPSGVDEVHNN